MKIASGPPEEICDAEASPGGAAWNPDGAILFSPRLSDGFLSGGFYRVLAAGGREQRVLRIDESKNEQATSG